MSVDSVLRQETVTLSGISDHDIILMSSKSTILIFEETDETFTLTIEVENTQIVIIERMKNTLSLRAAFNLNIARGITDIPQEELSLL